MNWKNKILQYDNMNQNLVMIRQEITKEQFKKYRDIIHKYWLMTTDNGRYNKALCEKMKEELLKEGWKWEL